MGTLNRCGSPLFYRHLKSRLATTKQNTADDGRGGGKKKQAFLRGYFLKVEVSFSKLTSLGGDFKELLKGTAAGL